ncbi:MAG: YDG domain-containing protein, partial [Janthinobacterium sp.]
VAGNKIVTLTSRYSGADIANYVFTDQATTTAAITPKALTVSGLAVANRSYDGTTAATVDLSGATYTGLIAGDVVTVAASGSFADKNAGADKLATLNSSYSGADVGNYTLASTTSSGVANITQKALTVTGVTAASRDYDGTRDAVLSGGALSGLVSGETLNLDLTNQTGVFADKNAGSGKVVTVTGATISDGATGLASNYAFSKASGVTANISKAERTC